MKIELSPSHDLPRLVKRYSERGRIQIRDLFVEAGAEAILAEIEKLPWGLAFNQGQQVVELDAQRLARIGQAESARMLAEIYEGARSGYQFLYAYYPLLTAYFSPQHPDMPLFRAYEFINSPPFLDFIRELTGLRSIKWADAQATCFRAGHFLKYHTDENPAQRRAAAYVLNFTKSWGRDWGGYLQFFNDRYDVEEGYRPVFNAINIFTIPADHSVSAVASYVQSSRYSITGWFREDDPPGPFRG